MLNEFHPVNHANNAATGNLHTHLSVSSRLRDMTHAREFAQLPAAFFTLLSAPLCSSSFATSVAPSLQQTISAVRPS